MTEQTTVNSLGLGFQIFDQSEIGDSKLKESYN